MLITMKITKTTPLRAEVSRVRLVRSSLIQHLTSRGDVKDALPCTPPETANLVREGITGSSIRYKATSYSLQYIL